MKVLISGAHGLVGRALSGALTEQGCTVRPLLRGREWKPETGEVNLSALNEWQPDALVHLAGDGIASRRWNPQQKERIRTSRVEATQRLAASLQKLHAPLKVFLGASAVGYYGDRGDEVLTEQSAAGEGFLPRVCEQWEAAAAPLGESGTRVAHLRFGMILSADGGALARMLRPFKLGIGGRLGNGKQWVSWIAIEDVIRLVLWVFTNAGAHGPYNAVSPQPVRNAEFTRELARALHRPAIFPAPAPALRLFFGEMADALLLSSQRAVPERLLQEGFNFAFPDLPSALRRIL